MNESSTIESEKSEILLVDDLEANLIAMEASLSAPDRNILLANSGEEALSLTFDHKFAVILLDVQMPEMNGYECAELLRGNEKTRHIPIIFATAFDKEEHQVFKGYEAGAVDYLIKPIDPLILRSKVNVFCTLHEQYQRLQAQMVEIEEKNRLLEKQLQEIKILQGFLPICSHCKKVRDDEGYWEAIEIYIRDRADVKFSHGICPDCYKILAAEIDESSP